ncbi:unnamed protein product [Sphagnum balticum]
MKTNAVLVAANEVVQGGLKFTTITSVVVSERKLSACLKRFRCIRRRFHLTHNPPLASDEVVEITPFNEEFAHVQVLRANGKSYSGYVDRLELDVSSEPGDLPKPELLAKRQWALLAGAQFVMLSQGSKTIEDDDNVQYTTSGYRSSTRPNFLVFKRVNSIFWRLEFAYINTNYNTSATQNIQGASYLKRNIEAKCDFRMRLTSTWSAFAEVRLSVIASESPLLIGYEGGLGLIYWL